MAALSRPSFSVVIPTLDEESTIRSTLRHARIAFGRSAELIVVDGGSRDRTRDVVGSLAHVLVAPRGRGAQLRSGSRRARGDLIVFLHADTRVESGAASKVAAAFADPSVSGGCCRFAVDPLARPFSRFAFLERGINWRTRVFRTATGDQAIIARREALERIGGVPPLPLFEDIALVRRLKRIGRFARLDVTAYTSRRRWEEQGFWPTVLQHWVLHLGFWLGVPPSWLAAWYEGRRSRSVDEVERPATDPA